MAYRMSALVLFTSLLALGSAFADPNPTTAPSKREQEAMWYRQTMVDSYDHAGHCSKEWDGAAVRALQAWAKIQSDTDVARDAYDTVYFDTKETLRANCDDPWVLYVAARDRMAFDRDPREWHPMLYKAADRIVESNYPACLKCIALCRAAEYHAKELDDEDANTKARKYFDEATEQLPAIADDQAIPTKELLTITETLRVACDAVGEDPAKVFENAQAIFDKRHKDRSAVLTMRGQFYVAYAWQGRGHAYADGVTPGQQKLMTERMAIAESACEEAWKLDPSNQEAALLMISVEKGQGRGKDRMNQWWTRAVDADPVRAYDAHLAKLGYLEPKWYGSAEEMLEFARQCVAQPGQDDRSPLVLIEAYLTISRYTRDGVKAQPQRSLFAQHPKVWNEIQPVYETFVSNHSDSLYHQSRLAQLALWSNHPEVAKKHLDAMGKKFSYMIFWTDAGYRRVRKEIDDMLK